MKLRDIIEGIVAVIIVVLCVGAEILVMYKGTPPGLDQVVTGRILGTLDALVLIVANFYFGSTRSSMQQVEAITAIGQAAANTPIHIAMPGGEMTTTTPVVEAAKVAVSKVTTAPIESHM